MTPASKYQRFPFKEGSQFGRRLPPPNMKPDSSSLVGFRGKPGNIYKEYDSEVILIGTILVHSITTVLEYYSSADVI